MTPAASEAPPELGFIRVDQGHSGIFLGFVEKYYAFDGIAFDRNAALQGVLELSQTPALGSAWLVREGVRFAGHFVLSYGFDLEFGGRQATLTELYLEEAARNRGIGRATLAFIERTLEEAGIFTLELQVERDNHEARTFYQRLGFVAHDRIPLSKRLNAVK